MTDKDLKHIYTAHIPELRAIDSLAEIWYNPQKEGIFAMKHVPVLLFLLPLVATAAAVPNPSVHCVRFDKDQYVDTGVPARTGVKIELVAEWSNPNEDNGVFGARIGDNRFYPVHVYEGKLSYGAGSFNKISGATIVADTVYTIVSDFADDLQTISVDGTTVWSGTAATGMSLTDTTLYLGAVNYSGAQYKCAMTVYSARIWLDGELVRDYRPDLRDGVSGFYDAANDGAFAPSSSSHDFAIVPRWTSGEPDAFVEWISSSTDGNGIDTLVRARSGLSFEGKMRWNSIDAKANGSEYNYLGAYRSKQNYLAPVHVVSNQLWLAYGNGNTYGTHRFYLTHADGTPAAVTAGTDYTFSAVMSNGEQTLVWNGETVHSGTLAQSVDFADDIAVFAAGSWGGFADQASARCYWLKIWRDGTLVRDLVPAVKDGEGVLYDRVEGICLHAWRALGPTRIGPPLSAARKPVRFCEYVGSTGEQYIDTGIIGRSDTKVEATIEWLKVDGEDVTVIGSRKDNSTRFYPAHCYNNSMTYGYYNYFSLGTAPFVVGQKYVFESELYEGAQKITLDGVVKATDTQGAINTGLTMYLYALHYGNNVQCKARVRIYDLKIWQDGELVRDYVPVIADNGAPHLWDKVSKTLCGSATATPFWDSGEMGGSFQPGLIFIVR